MKRSEAIAVDTTSVSDFESGRKREIIDAAAAVFCERGYTGGSMREIARRVGVSEPALYRHFPGKEALFLALIRVVAARMRTEAFALVDSAQPGAIRSQLLVAFADRRRAMASYGPVLRTVFSAASYNPAFLAEYRARLIEPTRVRLADKAAELDAALGVPRAAETRDARVRALMALLFGYFVTAMVMEDTADEPIADAVLRVMGWEGT